MIDYFSKHQLDINKYNACIANSKNSRIYAYSWYLDCVSDDWDALVLDNYTAVMPLPKRKKYGLNYIYLPPWIQQLGIFSLKDLNEELILKFLQAIPRKFVLIDLFLNSGNYCNDKNITLRDNYILPLNTSYDVLYNNFSKRRKRSVNQAVKYGLKIEQSKDFITLIHIFKAYKNTIYDKNNKDYDVLIRLIEFLIPIQKVKIFHIKNIENKVVGGAIFLVDKHRITYLFSAISTLGRKQQAMSFLINHIVKIYADSNLILDFEGSMINKIATFFESFGSIIEPYYHFKQKRLNMF